jgi:hypothetical protein
MQLCRCSRSIPERRLCRRRVLDPHEGAVRGSEQKIGVNQGTEERRAGRRIEVPETLGLLFRQPQSGHFQELSLHPPEHVFRSARLLGHTPSPLKIKPGGNSTVERATDVPQDISDSRQGAGIRFEKNVGFLDDSMIRENLRAGSMSSVCPRV